MRTKWVYITVSFGLVIQCLFSCGNHSKTANEPIQQPIMAKKSNPVVYFEIPVTDMSRAITFYSRVFHFTFDLDHIDNYEMGLFPFSEESTGISGALAKGDIYKPTKDGVIIYFTTDNIDQTLALVTSNGGEILYPKTDNGIGLVAEFEDTEGNRIALFQAK